MATCVSFRLLHDRCKTRAKEMIPPTPILPCVYLLNVDVVSLVRLFLSVRILCNLTPCRVRLWTASKACGIRTRTCVTALEIEKLLAVIGLMHLWFSYKKNP